MKGSSFDSMKLFENFSDNEGDAGEVGQGSNFYYDRSEGDGFDSISEIVKLWRAVISQGLSDLRSRSGRSEIKDVKNRIYHMINDSNNNNHFTEICNMARLNPQIVKNKFKTILEVK